MYLMRGSDVLIRAKIMQDSLITSTAGSPVGRFQMLNTDTGEVVDKYLYIDGNPKQYRFDAKEGNSPFITTRITLKSWTRRCLFNPLPGAFSPMTSWGRG
jgi:hypothetical protein